MKERKSWSKEEDKILKFLREQAGQKKWSKIAKKLEDQYSMLGRTGKQCRQRYHNHLDSSINFSQWTAEQQKTLFQMHDQVGNRWSIIAHKLPGRTDNCIKNHFYSKLRKAVRRLNRIMMDQFKKGFRQIKTSVLYKIIETSQSKFQIGSMIDQEVADFCTDLKNRLFNFQEEFSELQRSQKSNLEFAKNLIMEIAQFQSSCKKTSTKRRKNSSTANDLLHPSMYIKKTKSNSQCSYSDQSSSFMSSSSFVDQSQQDEDDLRGTSKSLKQKVNSFCTTKSAYTVGENLRLTRSRSRQESFSGNASVQCLSDNAQKLKKYDFGSFSGQNFLSVHTQSKKEQPFQSFNGFLSNSRTSNEANFIDSIMIEQKILQQKSSGSNKNSQSNHSQINMFFEDSHFQMRILSPKNLIQRKNQSQYDHFDIMQLHKRDMEMQMEGLQINNQEDQIRSQVNSQIKTVSLKQRVVVYYQENDSVKKQAQEDSPVQNQQNNEGVQLKQKYLQDQQPK